MPVSMRRFRPATRTMKNSSRLEAKIAAKLLERFRYYVENIPQRAFYAEYKRRSFVVGKRVEVRSGDLCESGVALDLDENCFLKVWLDSGQEKLLSGGEVSIKVQ